MSRHTFLTLARATAGIVGTRSFHFAPDDPIVDANSEPDAVAAAAAAANAAHDAAELAKANAIKPPDEPDDATLEAALLAAHKETRTPPKEEKEEGAAAEETADDDDEDDEDDDELEDSVAGADAGDDTTKGAAGGDTVVADAGTDTLAAAAADTLAGADAVEPIAQDTAQPSRYASGLKLTETLLNAIKRVEEDEVMPDGQKASELARLHVSLSEHQEKQQERFVADVEDDWKRESAKHGLPVDTLKTLWKEEGAKLLAANYKGEALGGALKYAFGMRVAAAKVTKKTNPSPSAPAASTTAATAAAAAATAGKRGARVEPPAAKTPITSAGARVAPPVSTLRAAKEPLSDEDELLQTVRKSKGGIRSLLS